ncbi:hypothetical protein ASL20_13945 [Cupriavidus necator]|nr:hypothetical protein ASL20_13945 [Cupriavidus necator]
MVGNLGLIHVTVRIGSEVNGYEATTELNIPGQFKELNLFSLGSLVEDPVNEIAIRILTRSQDLI